MISRKGLNDLIADYRTALGKINDAAHALEDGALQMGSMGFEFTRTSVRIIDHTNDLYAEINQTLARLREVTPNDQDYRPADEQ